MNTQDKIKELIEQYKEHQSLGYPRCNTYMEIIDDLETLLEPECKHNNTEPKLYNKSDGILEQYQKIFDSKCADCGRLVSTTYEN